MVKKIVQLRKDLQKSGMKVPIGNIYFFGSEKLNYRWQNEDIFEVYYKTEWLEAYSIDWDFIE